MRLRQTGPFRDDLKRLYRQGIEMFGERQADRYYDGLLTLVDQLLAFPESAPARLSGKTEVRVATYQSHRIIYRLMGDELVLLRLLHGHQDMVRHLKL
jgi:toxin ParE1/3/4